MAAVVWFAFFGQMMDGATQAPQLRPNSCSGVGGLDFGVGILVWILGLLVSRSFRLRSFCRVWLFGRVFLEFAPVLRGFGAPAFARAGVGSAEVTAGLQVPQGHGCLSFSWQQAS